MNRIPILVYLLATFAGAVPVTFSWDAKPDEKITRTDIFKVSKAGERTFVATSNGTTATTDLPAGTYTFTAASQNDSGWGPFAETITVTITEPIIPKPSKPTGLKVTFK